MRSVAEIEALHDVLMNATRVLNTCALAVSESFRHGGRHGKAYSTAQSAYIAACEYVEHLRSALATAHYAPKDGA